MRRLWIALTAVAVALAGCVGAASPASPSAAASPTVICDTTQFQPTPSLTCGSAITVALAALAPGHAPVTRVEFRWGGLCPPGAPCVAPLGNAGIVIVAFASGPPVFVYVSAGADGVVAASSPAPYPSGY
jgi:hypothetical protein